MKYLKLYTVSVTGVENKSIVSIVPGFQILNVLEDKEDGENGKDEGNKERNVFFSPGGSFPVSTGPDYQKDIAEGRAIFHADLIEAPEPHLQIPPQINSDSTLVLICWKGIYALTPDTPSNLVRIRGTTIGNNPSGERVVITAIVLLKDFQKIKVAPRKTIRNSLGTLRIE
jgi:hypothetical protein